ncbi:hypothetical protein CL619_05230 [archaeon]|nr:hypothetical protein [archaeon]
MESKLRSMLKSITFRGVAILVTLAVSYFFLGSIFQSIFFTVVMNIVGMLVYYLHERAWNVFTWHREG